MGNIGDTISDSAPAVSTSGPGYATTINALLTEFKSRLSARIPLSSLLTNSNLDLNGQALLNAAYLTLANESVSPVASPVNRVAAYGGNLWWVSPSGAVQLTSGASLNAAGVGGITGDYSGAGPMEFRYDTGNTRYDAFANQATNTWAYVRARGFDIAGSATSAFRARLLFGGTANVSYTLPAAVPASTAPMQMSATGVITADPEDDIVLTGAADYKHGEKSFSFTPTINSVIASSGTYSVNIPVIGDVVTHTLSATGVAYIPLTGLLRENCRVTEVQLRGEVSFTDPTVDLVLQEGDNGTAGLGTASGSLALGGGSITVTGSIAIVPTQCPQLWLKVSGGGDAVTIYCVTVKYELV